MFSATINIRLDEFVPSVYAMSSRNLSVSDGKYSPSFREKKPVFGGEMIDGPAEGQNPSVGIPRWEKLGHS